MKQEGNGPTSFRRGEGNCTRISSWGCRAEAPGEAATALLNEDVVRGQAVVVQESQMAVYVHVDDGLILSEWQPATWQRNYVMMNELADGLEEAGFRVTDRKADGEVDKIVGYEPQRAPAMLRVPLKKSWLLYEALRWLASQPTVVIEDLRAAVGVWVWAALLARHWLVVPHAVFRFMEVHRGRRAVWWESARREVLVMSRAVMGLYADLGAPLLPFSLPRTRRAPMLPTMEASGWSASR